MSVAKERKEARLKRRVRVRKKIRGTAERPRLCVFRSAKHIYAQLIDDVAGQTLAAVSSLDSSVAGAGGGNIDSAKAIGKAIADKAKAAKIIDVVFDRNGFLYHGRVKALAEAAREAGLKF